MIDGRIAGKWTREFSEDEVIVTTKCFRWISSWEIRRVCETDNRLEEKEDIFMVRIDFKVKGRKRASV